MSQLANKQLYLIVELAGGCVVPRAMLPPPVGSAYARVLQLAASLCGYLGSHVRPSMAILGKQLAWGGSGVATIVPKLGVADFLREIFRGRPVIFVNSPSDHPYAALSRVLRFDASENLDVLLNGNSCLAVAGSRDGKKVFVHVGANPEGRDALVRHEQGLSQARTALMETSLLHAMAIPMATHQERAVSVFAETHLDGRKIDISKVSLAECETSLMSAARPLLDIHMASFGNELPERHLLDRMERDLPTVDIDPSLMALIENLIVEVRQWLRERRPGSVQVHGDYSLSNVLFDAHGEVCALLDWEWTRAQGCAGFDAIYLGIATAAGKLGIDQTTLAGEIIRSGELPALLERYVRAIMPGLGLTTADLVPLTKLVWLTIVFRSAVWTRPTYDDWMAKTVAAMQDRIRDMQ